jgi:hypothetical protein
MGARENRTGIFELGQDPELADLFRVALRGLVLSLRTHSVATIVSYNPATQRATVRVDALQVIKDLGVTPTRANPLPTSTQAPIVLDDVPVAFPRTSSGYVTFPLSAGDTGELHVQDRSLDQWLEVGQATDPVSAFTHSLADSVFHPNLFPSSSPISPPTSSTATVVEGPTINLGPLAASPLVKGDQLSSAFVAYCTTIAAAFATWGGIVPPTAVSNGKFLAEIGAATATLAATIGSWNSTKSLTE